MEDLAADFAAGVAAWLLDGALAGCAEPLLGAFVLAAGFDAAFDWAGLGSSAVGSGGAPIRLNHGP